MSGMVKAEPGAVDPMEGWLKKKCHHIGVWKYRFFKFDGRVLRYWKRKYQADSDKPPRGEFTLTRCHAFPARGQCLVLHAPNRPFDEELLAASDEERDAWVRLLNGAALQHRISVGSHQISTERFLRAHGLWVLLEGAIGADVEGASAGLAIATSVNHPSEVRGTTAESVASTCWGGEEAVLKHVHCGYVLLQLADNPLAPRQGRFVAAGRRALQNIRGQRGGPEEPAAEKGRSESWVLLASVRNLATNAPLGPIRRADSFYKHVEGELPSGGSADGTPLLEALHAYGEPLDKSPPFASLPLARCWVSMEEECPDGSGWSVYVENRAESGGRPCAWTLIVGSREECARWRRVIDVAIWAARAREAGRLRLAEEALQLFDGRHAAWRAALARRLAEVAADAPARRGAPGAGAWSSRAGTAEDPVNASAALRRVLTACREVCEDATDMLDAALSQEPMRRDICEAALEAAVDPAVACAGRCWAHSNLVLSHGDGRALLRWLDAQRRALHRLGLLHAPLDAAVAGLAVELSLRTGAHLRRIALQLLVREFTEAMRARAPPGSSGGQAAAGASAGGQLERPRRPSVDAGSGAPTPTEPEYERAQSTLPVDLFTMIFSCMPFDRDQDVLALRLSSQRVAKFVVYELQQVIWEWLSATLPEVHREIKSKPGNAGAPEQGLPTRSRQWFACVAALANGAPALAAQCRELGAVPLRSGDDGPRSRELLHTFASPDESDLGCETLPSEWGLEAEEQRFGSLREAALWALCDVASVRWRRLALSGAELPAEETALGVGGLLKAQFDGQLRLLRDWLEPGVFGQFLPKLFHVCLAGYILRLSRGLWFQLPLQGEPTEMAFFQLSEDTLHICRYFQALAVGGAAAEGGEPWEPGRVLTRLHAVLCSPTSYQKWRPVVSSGPHPAPGAKSQGPQKDGLGSLAAVLSEGPLPLRDVVAWFGARPPLDLFDELPPPAPWGGDFAGHLLGPGPGRRMSSPSVSRYSSQESVGKQASLDSRGQRKRISMPSLSLYGKAPEQLSDPTPSEPSSHAGGVETAEEGSICELRVEDVGAHGAFCGISCSHEASPSEASSFHSASSSPGCGPGSAAAAAGPPQRLRRRWAQLARQLPGRAAAFEVLSSRPTCLQDDGVRVLASLPLPRLAEASPLGATGLRLRFRPEGGIKEADDNVLRPQEYYHIVFDCPSHLFRWRLVLEAWTSVTIPKLQPIVALGGSSANRLLSGWEDLPQELTRQVLEQRLGGLWSDVRIHLQAGGPAPRSGTSGRSSGWEDRGRR